MFFFFFIKSNNFLITIKKWIFIIHSFSFEFRMGKKCLVYQPRAPAHWYLLVSIIIYDKQFLVASLEYSPRPVSCLFYIKTLIVSRWFTLLDVSCLSYFERKKNSHNKHKENKAYTMKFRRLYFQDNWICIHVMFYFFFFFTFLDDLQSVIYNNNE